MNTIIEERKKDLISILFYMSDNEINFNGTIVKEHKSEKNNIFFIMNEFGGLKLHHITEENYLKNHIFYDGIMSLNLNIYHNIKEQENLLIELISFKDKLDLQDRLLNDLNTKNNKKGLIKL